MDKIANISHSSFSTYTGTPIPTDYKFCCWVGDVNEKELLEVENNNDRDIIQVVFPDKLDKTCATCQVFRFKDDPDITCMDECVGQTGCSSWMAQFSKAEIEQYMKR